ncbi:MAG TPA: hypothetical protein VGI40_06205 [Pirellulaceae bacterium]|jgi:hypothetical protein
MISSSLPTNEIDILAQLVAPDEPSFEPEFARWVLGMRFSDETQTRIQELLEKNNAGSLDDTGRRLLDKYLRVGDFVDLLQAKARLTLHQTAGK